MYAHDLHDHEIEDIGVNEHLGAKIPLDPVFRDETGRQVHCRTGYRADHHPAGLLQLHQCLQFSAERAGPCPAGDQAEARQGLPGHLGQLRRDGDPGAGGPVQADVPDRHEGALSREGWRFLTGDAASIRRLTDAAGYRFQRKGRDFIHPVASFVVAGDGTIVRYLYGTTFLPKDLTLALIEAREGKVGTTIRKVVDYCFTFDPADKTYVFNLLRVSATVVILCAGGFLPF